MLGWLLASASAEAPDAPWWLGLPLADVQLQAADGALPDANLEPLLRARELEPLDPETVRLDLATLFRVGEFSGVEAHLEPWTVFDAAGDPSPGALLTYVVYPAPRVARVRVLGNRAFSNRDLLDALDVVKGDVFYPGLGDEAAADRAETWLYRKGWTRAEVQIRTSEPEPGKLHVVADVNEGEPTTLQRLVFAGELEGVATDRELERWARREGVAEGEPLAPDAVTKAQDAIRERLGSVRGGVFEPRRGWIGARVTPAIVETDEGVRATYVIEPGPRLELVVLGMGFNGRRKVETILGIDHRLRVTRGWLDQAPDRMVSALQERGWYAALVDVADEHPTDDVEVLTVDVRRGPRHRTLRPFRERGLFGTFVDVSFHFPEDMDRKERRRQARDLQSVLDQASPEVLRRDAYTEAEMEVGLEAARQYYLDHGHLEARLELGEPEIAPRRTPRSLYLAAAGLEPNQRITPQVTVVPGPVTTLEALDVVGAAAEAELWFVEEAREEQVGEPFSPQDLEALRQRVVEAHRAEGYRDVEARVVSEPVGEGRRRSTIEVDPGPLVLLRSAVTRGTRFTKQPFVQREIDATMELGAPIRSRDLELLRSRLYDLGAFSSVSPDLLGEVGDDARDLVVTVVERKRWQFELGGGVATDQGVRTYGRLLRRNLWGLAHRWELFGQVGFEWRSEDLADWLPDFSQPEWRIATTYTAPRFPLRRQQLVLDVVFRERIQERTWRMDRTGGGAAVETDLPCSGGPTRCETRFRLGARLESRQLDQIDPAALLAGEPWPELLGLGEIPGEGLFGVPVLPSPARWQESLTGLAVLDLRDDPVDPHRGALVSGDLEYAPGLRWPEQPRTAFLKAEGRVSGYVPIGAFTLHVAGSGGHIGSFGDTVVPLEDRFRLGGTGSLRGYVRDGVGPQNRWPRFSVDWPDALDPVINYALRDDPERWTPTGGDTAASGSVDLQMPLPALGLTGWEGYRAELFVDAGNVWLLDPDATATSELPRYRGLLPAVRIGLGAGVGVDTPIGPLQVDLAINPQVLLADQLRRELLVDAWEEPWVRAHLTLGALW